jgi:MoaA/NifB/PqqE/SkfB family radical SAM enzyme
MSLEDIRNYLDEAVSVSNLESFMVFGGEPMLFPDRAINAFEKAHKQSIPKISMLTNGVWGKDLAKAEELACRMKKSGLNILGISVDAFHSQFIPLEYPKRAALASIQAGIADVTWNVAVVESLSGENKYDKKTARVLKLLEPVGIEAHVHKVLPVGRAARNLRQYFKRESLRGPCVGDPILENALTSPECITIEPSGEVSICWNLAIGNAKQKPLNQIICDYEWKRNPVIRTLVEEGPIGLVEDARRKGFRFRSAQYVNKCHLCIEVRRTPGSIDVASASN